MVVKGLSSQSILLTNHSFKLFWRWLAHCFEFFQLQLLWFKGVGMKVVTMIIYDYLNWQGFELDQIETKSQKKKSF